MKIIVSELPEEGLDIDLSEPELSESLPLLGPLRATVNIRRKAREVVIKGNLSGEVGLQCSRCLQDFVFPVNADMMLVYRPAVDIGGEEIHELKGAELDTGFFSNDIIDTTELLTEQALLAIPMKPLCSEDCKGMCPRCGADRNRDQCSCTDQASDPRFEGLHYLLKKKE